jgi:hypothetical protein
VEAALTLHTTVDGTVDGTLETVRTIPGTDGADTPTVSFDGSTYLVIASLSGGTGPDGSEDAVTLDGASLLDTEGIPEDINGRTAALFEFGRNDTLTVSGVSGDRAHVSIVTNDSGAELPDQFAGAGSVGLMTFENSESSVVFATSTATTPFESQSDFLNRVQFEQNGDLPEAEIPGVFDLPDEPPEGGTIDVPSITVEVDGEEVTFDPTDPFWFEDIPADAREQILTDPEIAVGYDYRIANPSDGQAFATIRAPAVNGDQSYNLIVFDETGSAQESREIQAGQDIDLEADYDFPVTNFVIEDIDPQANLDPNDARAFPLAVSFTQSGDVDMQQTPLVRGFEFGVGDEASVAETVSAFYVGYYGRSPDPDGHGYWEGFVRDLVDDGASLDRALAEVSNRFADANETLTQYPFLDRDADAGITDSDADQFVTDLFQNIFERGPEQEGLDFWSNEVVDRIQNDQPIGDIIVDIVSGARGVDAVTVGNKIDVGTEFAQTFSADDLEGNPDVPGLEDIIANVDDGDASVAEARQQIADAAGQAGTESVSAVGVPVQEDDSPIAG